MKPEAFLHHFERGTDPAAPLWLLLHGTGGNERDLLPLARQLVPEAPLLAPRGPVLENGLPRFFRRFAEGVFDEDDIRRRAADLAAWIPVAAGRHGAAGRPVRALGFSNGANIAAALLLLQPGVLAGAVLIRAMVPLAPEPPPAPAPSSVLLLSGMEDPIVPRENARRLAGLLRRAGARVDHRELPAGHAPTRGDVEAATSWCAGAATVALPR